MPSFQGPSHRKPPPMDILAVQKWAYIEGAPSYNATAYGFLQQYSGIPEEDVDNHLLDIVRHSWLVSLVRSC